MHGAETELDRQVLDRIKDPLTHMVRNSADHGLEMPAERLAKGKPEKGTVRLSAYHEGGHIIIEIADDGRGLDTDKIKAKAICQGPRQRRRDRKDVGGADPALHLRGRLLDRRARSRASPAAASAWTSCMSNIDQIGGSVDVKSIPGEGSIFTIKIPLTLAIISALIIEAGGERFAIPQLAVIELVRVKNNTEHRIEHIKDTPGAAPAQQAPAADPSRPPARSRQQGHAGQSRPASSWSPRSAAACSASWSTACSTPRKSS